jgi:hypothetical protein
VNDFSIGMKIRSIILLMRLTKWQHMSGGRVRCIAYCPFLRILVHGLGSNGAEERKFSGCKSMLKLNMIILVSAHADQELFTKE